MFYTALKMLEQRPIEKIDETAMETDSSEQAVMYASMPEFATALNRIEERQKGQEIQRSLAEARLGPYIVYRDNIGYVALAEQLRIKL